MHSVAIQEQIEESQRRFDKVTRKLEEAKKIRENVSSIDVLILATTQALRERERGKCSGGHSMIAEVLDRIKDNEYLATQVRIFIDDNFDDLEDEEAKEELEEGYE